VIPAGALQRWAPLPLRLALGTGMVQHGAIKLFDAYGRDNIAHLVSQLDLPAPSLVGYLIGVIEFGGGLALIAGGWTRVAGTAIALSIAVLLASSWRRGGIPDPLPGGDPFPSYTLGALILAGTVSLVLSGAGALSLDGRRGTPKSGREA
jgi:putative oxidoreductase